LWLIKAVRGFQATHKGDQESQPQRTQGTQGNYFSSCLFVHFVVHIRKGTSSASMGSFSRSLSPSSPSRGFPARATTPFAWREVELEVLRWLKSELSGPEIARTLNISLNTVRYHTKNIYSKLQVGNRREAVRRAEELGL
jgi:DNA-binding CsgD family transcriptional regulator